MTTKPKPSDSNRTGACTDQAVQILLVIEDQARRDALIVLLREAAPKSVIETRASVIDAIARPAGRALDLIVLDLTDHHESNPLETIRQMARMMTTAKLFTFGTPTNVAPALGYAVQPWSAAPSLLRRWLGQRQPGAQRDAT